MTDEELKNVKMFVVEYYVYLDIMSKTKKSDDIVVTSSGGSNESNNQENN